jgi:hypothetical protein
VALRATVSDNVGVTASRSLYGGLTTFGTSPVSPAVTAGSDSLDLNPGEHPNGQPSTSTPRARRRTIRATKTAALTDAGAPALTILEPDGAVAPGGSITVRAHATGRWQCGA